MKRKFFYVCIVVCLTLLFSSCGKANNSTNASDEGNGKPMVAVSVVPEATFVKAVAGDLIDVVTLIPPGQSPENYQPTITSMQKLSDSSLYFAIGVPTEDSNILPKIDDLNKDIKIVYLNKKVAEVYPQREFAPGSVDPHIWMSPKRVKVIISIIENELSSLDPKHKDEYKKNADEYVNNIEELNDYIVNSYKDIKNNTIITYHPSLGYYCEDYGLNMLTVEQEGKDSSPKDLEKLIDTARNKNIKVIFCQSEIDSRQSKSFAESIDGKIVEINPLASDYINNMKEITDKIVESLK